MPFFVIKGTFHVLGTSPNGDSIRFRADDDSKWNLLAASPNPPVMLKGPAHAAQLRFEGIDAPETHYQLPNSVYQYHQPLPFGIAARDRLLAEVGIEGVVWNSPGIITQAQDGARGYILSRATDKYGRPVAFVYAGDPPLSIADGSSLRLDVAHLRESVNYKLAAAGLVYPAYYKGLFPDLRLELTAAIGNARQAGIGVWSKDKTNSGVDVIDLGSVTDRHLILPKLFRRIVEYIDGGGGIEGFDDFLAARQEGVLALSQGHFTHLDNVVNVEGTTVSLSRPPEDLVFL